jgi:predicted outer membrane lipoprotein
MFGWVLLAAPLALIFAVGAAIWLEGHIVDQPDEEAVSPVTPTDTFPTVPSRT